MLIFLSCLVSYSKEASWVRRTRFLLMLFLDNGDCWAWVSSISSPPSMGGDKGEGEVLSLKPACHPALDAGSRNCGNLTPHAVIARSDATRQSRSVPVILSEVEESAFLQTFNCLIYGA